VHAEPTRHAAADSIPANCEVIEVHVAELKQLFNAIDPSPGIVTYEIGGVQYVAVAGGMKNTVTQQTDSGPAWVAILSVPKQ
jgi:hypothetical protein